MYDNQIQKELSIQDIHYCLLEMLRVIDEVCKKHNIMYFLSGGTAIGAIREKGFIPWDDDLDIMLPRSDYEKLISSLEDEDTGHFRVYSLRDQSWNRPYSCFVDERTVAKHELVEYSHLGVTIDILPIDGLSSSKAEVLRYYRLLKVEYALYYSSLKVNFSPEEKLKLLKKTASVVTKRIGAHSFCVHIDKKAKSKPFETSEYVGCSILTHYMEKEWFKKDWFQEQLFVPFEDSEYPVMIGYDNYLSSLYGNYMRRPDQEGNPEHRTKYYWKDL